MGKAEGKCGGWTGKQAGIACEAKVGVCRVGGSGELGKRRRDGCRGRRRKGPCQQRRAPGPPLELWSKTPRPHAFLMETWSCLAWSCLGAGTGPARFACPACGTEPHRCQAPIFFAGSSARHIRVDNDAGVCSRHAAPATRPSGILVAASGCHRSMCPALSGACVGRPRRGRVRDAPCPESIGWHPISSKKHTGRPSRIGDHPIVTCHEESLHSPRRIYCTWM